MVHSLSTSEILFGLAVMLPLASFILCFLIPERYSWLVSITASVLILISTLASVSLFFSADSLVINVPWFTLGSSILSLDFSLNALSRLMLAVVSVISLLIHIYSTGYMAGDSGIRRYFAMLGFFTFAMLGIVISSNIILLFVFWELVGFASYLLIGHWTERPAAGMAAQKAFIFNRIADAVLLVGIMILWNKDLSANNSYWMTLAGLCIFGGVIGKSAQLPLSSWLPAAMEGPTPVSALLHSATMVAAGIILLLKFSAFLTTITLTVITITGASTALFGAVCALNQFDIKKILAYSTISQLGLMLIAVGIGAGDAATLHLFTHAFFKAGLFLAAGSVLHALNHQQIQAENKFDIQDIRNLGGLRKSLPFTFLIFCITGASLSGIPFLSGFLSKDSILAAIWNQPDFSGLKWILLISVLVISFCTVLYTFRLIRFIFLGEESKLIVHESPWVMRVPMLLLAIGSGWLIVSFNPLNVNGWFANSFRGILHSTEISILSACVSLTALAVAWVIYSKKTSPKAIPFIQNGFNLDLFYERTFGRLILKLATVTETTDKKWIDGIIHLTAYTQVVIAHGIAWFDQYIVDGVVNTSARLAKSLGLLTRSFQGGKIQLYIFWAVTGLIIFLFFALI